jgi:hypothetical protein
MNDMLAMLGRWQLDEKAVRERMYSAATPRERERWFGVWLLARGWSAVQVAEALERRVFECPIGDWVADLREKGPAGLAFEQTVGPPPPSTRHNRPS